ncbi:hypothetical protein M8C21_006762, partial [Ambrosia artemisiifolia]
IFLCLIVSRCQVLDLTSKLRAGESLYIQLDVDLPMVMSEVIDGSSGAVVANLIAHGLIGVPARHNIGSEECRIVPLLLCVCSFRPRWNRDEEELRRRQKAKVLTDLEFPTRTRTGHLMLYNSTCQLGM